MPLQRDKAALKRGALGARRGPNFCRPEDTVRITGEDMESPMKLLKTGIVALPLTVTATFGLAADYELFADTPQS